MPSSGFKVKINKPSQIIKDHKLEDNGLVERFLRDTSDRLMAPFVPGGAGGSLEKLKVYPSNHQIKYISPGARYQFGGKVYISPKLGVSGILLKNNVWWSPKGEKKRATNKKIKYHTSGTGDHWDKRMLKKRKNDLIKDVENYIKSGG